MRDDKEKLEKILDCIDQVKEYTRGGEDEFFKNRLIQDGVVRNFQVIGQAIKDLSVELKEKNQDVEWHKASRMRDKVSHDYLDVDYEIVWKTVEKDLSPLRDKIEDIHRRLVYKVPGDREKPSMLEMKLKDEHNLRLKAEDVFKIKQEKLKKPDRDDDKTR